MRRKGQVTFWTIAIFLVLCAAAYGSYSAGWLDQWFPKEKSESETKTSETEKQTSEDLCASEFCGDGQCAANCGETAQSCNNDCGIKTTTTALAAKPVEDLRGSCKDKFTMADVVVGNLSFYSPNADVSDPYILALDKLACGSNTTDMIIQTNTNYDLHYYDEAGTYYDDKLQNWQINYNPDTGKGYLLTGSAKLSYHGVSAVGAFASMDTLPEVQSGMDDNGTSLLCYNETTLGGSGWFQADIGNDNANSELREAVICFRDNDGDMEGTEVTALTASYVSGSTAISIPGDLKKYWQDAMGGGGAQCVDIAALLGSSVKARWQFAMTVDETAFSDSEEFEITFDDLGDYLQKQYPSRSAKASAVSLTVCNRGA